VVGHRPIVGQVGGSQQVVGHRPLVGQVGGGQQVVGHRPLVGQVGGGQQVVGHGQADVVVVTRGLGVVRAADGQHAIRGVGL